MKWLSGRRVVVTGGAGFIGSNLIDSLLENGNHVTCLDNFSTGRRQNISHFNDHNNFRLIEGDIRDLDTCFEAVRGSEIVFHQAALGSVPRSIKDPVTTTDVNVGGFVKMIFASKETGVKRFIYAASSSTYGDSTGLPKVEERIGKPLSPYGVTKYADELYAANFAQIYKIEVIGLRYFNVFGRRQDPDGPYAAVIPKFIKLLKNHEAPVINGDGTNSRDFTYIDNVLAANHLAALASDITALNQVYNVACGEQTSLNTLYDLLKKYLSPFDRAITDIRPAYGPGRDGDIPHSLASVEKAERLLGYKPVVGVEDGLKQSVEWFWNHL